MPTANEDLRTHGGALFVSGGKDNGVAMAGSVSGDLFAVECFSDGFGSIKFHNYDGGNKDLAVWKVPAAAVAAISNHWIAGRWWEVHFTSPTWNGQWFNADFARLELR